MESLKWWHRLPVDWFNMDYRFSLTDHLVYFRNKCFAFDWEFVVRGWILDVDVTYWCTSSTISKKMRAKLQ